MALLLARDRDAERGRGHDRAGREARLGLGGGHVEPAPRRRHGATPAPPGRARRGSAPSRGPRRRARRRSLARAGLGAEHELELRQRDDALLLRLERRARRSPALDARTVHLDARHVPRLEPLLRCASRPRSASRCASAASSARRRAAAARPSSSRTSAATRALVAASRRLGGAHGSTRRRDARAALTRRSRPAARRRPRTRPSGRAPPSRDPTPRRELRVRGQRHGRAFETSLRRPDLRLRRAHVGVLRERALDGGAERERLARARGARGRRDERQRHQLTERHVSSSSERAPARPGTTARPC